MSALETLSKAEIFVIPEKMQMDRTLDLNSMHEKYTKNN